MAKDFLTGALAVIACIAIGGHLLRGNLLQTPRDKLLYGLGTGSMGAMLLFFGTPAGDGGRIDYSLIAMIIVSVYGQSGVASLLAGLVIGAVRAIFFPASGLLSAGTALAVLVILGKVFGMIMPERRRRWIWLSGAGLITAAAPLFPLLRAGPEAGRTLFWYLFFYFAALVVAYSLAERIYETNANYDQYRRLAEKDWLTGLDNVRRFDAAINRLVAAGERFSLLLIDIDHFKRVNDTYGHPAGDAVLRELGGVLSGTCRSFDIISRYGGEEFAVLLPGCSCEKALEVAERIRARAAGHSFVLPDGRSIRITVSAGAAGYPETARTAEELIRRADNELYAAKITGRNRVSGSCGQ
ncbi:MAG: GGDEF domain-containing protein [bacterium]|jgi:diguanylate cyclase